MPPNITITAVIGSYLNEPGKRAVQNNETVKWCKPLHVFTNTRNVNFNRCYMLQKS